MVTAAVVMLSGCVSRYAILTVPAVSMTNASFEPGATYEDGGPVTAQYCTGDDSISSSDNNVGLIDEVVLKAQKESGAKYLRDVTIMSDGSCVDVEATAMK
jgi:hypothetical protein